MAMRHSYAESPNGAREQEEGQSLMGQMRGAGEAMQSQAQHVVAEYPISTVLAVFGVGLGVGCVLGSALFSSSSSYQSSSNWLPSMSTSGPSWFPSHASNHSWFGNGPSNWSDNLVQGAKNMCGY